MSERESPEMAYRHKRLLSRYAADLRFVDDYYGLTDSYLTYLLEQLNLSDEMQSRLHQALRDTLPTEEMFDHNQMQAKEQLAVALIQNGMPLIEEYTSDPDEFRSWLEQAVPIAINGGDKRHSVSGCGSYWRTNESPSCSLSSDCPIKVVGGLLVDESLQPNLDSPDYFKGWSDKKIENTLQKLDVANDNRLITKYFYEYAKKEYFYALQVRNISF